MYLLDVPLKSEYPILLRVWESSVRATHHFLEKEDIEFFKNTIQEKKVFDQLELIVARDNNKDILGIMGISKDSLEMLFVDSKYIGQGVGKALILHAIYNLNARKVEVNEQNIQAVKFYENFGFKVTSRSALDDYSKPYPILYMQRI